MTPVAMSPPRRRPRRIAKRVAKRHGARTFAGGETLHELERRRRLAVIARGAAYMCRAAAAMLRFNIVDQVASLEVGTRLLGGDETIAAQLDRFAAMGHRRPERTLAAVVRVAARRSSAR